MTHLYSKNELTFSLTWIICYVVLFSLADKFSVNSGTAKIITAPLSVIMAALLLVWIMKNGLSEKYGLQKVKIDYGKYLYFLPLIAITTTNLWGGLSVHLSVLETILHVISMICVGFVEEVIFRGFLFLALCQKNVKQAVLVSSLTFGIGHIVNLLNGAEVLSTLLQICYATAIGFLFTVIFYQSKTLIPCIIAHSVFNSLSAFAGERTNLLFHICTVAALTVVSLVYAMWIWKYGHPVNREELP